MKEIKKEVKSNRLRKLEKGLIIIEKSKDYLKQELSKIKNKERELREKMSGERKAIELSSKAKELRSSKRGN